MTKKRTEYFCDCFKKWSEEDGAWPKWVQINGCSPHKGVLYIECFEHGVKEVKL